MVTSLRAHVEAFLRSHPDVQVEPGVDAPGNPLHEVLSLTRGLRRGESSVNFTGELPFELDELSLIPIASDGVGNFAVLAAESILFASHDPAMLLFVAADLGTFLEEWLTAGATRIHALEPAVDSSATFIHDAELLEFVRILPAAARLADLRAKKRGAGLKFSPAERLVQSKTNPLLLAAIPR